MPYKGNKTIDCIIKHLDIEKPGFYKLFERRYNIFEMFFYIRNSMIRTCIFSVIKESKENFFKEKTKML